MTLRRPAFSLALALTLAVSPLAALAQEAGAESAAPATPDVSMGIPDGMPDRETAQINQIYLAGSFDAWELRCAKAEDGKDPCQLYQLLRDGEGGPVAEVMLFTLPEGGQAVLGASVLAPLETLLTQNLRIAIDGVQGKIYPFSYCTGNGCLAKVGFTAEEAAAMQKGNEAKVTIVPAAAPDATVVATVSLKGFTAAYDALKEAAAKAAN